MGVLAASLSRGSALRSDSDLARNLVLSQNIDTIREALCCDLTGSGYEIGAADRPTRLPDHCAVTYVDKFTYEEAADGSFIGKSPDHFVPVTIFESIEKLDSIANESADFFIACHVIEHVTDVIGGLCEMYRKLVIGGRSCAGRA